VGAGESRRAIASFFAEFTQESLATAAATSVRDAVRKDALASDGSRAAWPLLHGPHGVFARASPYEVVAGGRWEAIREEDRLAALSLANETATRLATLADGLSSPGSVATWMPAVQAVSVCQGGRGGFDALLGLQLGQLG
jgi:hypothetical protein